MDKLHSETSLACTETLTTTLTFAVHNILQLLFATFKHLTLYGHIQATQQRTIIQQYGDWYTGR